MKKIYAPAGQEDLVMVELPFDETLSRIVDHDDYVEIEHEGSKYEVNVGASRLRAIKKDLQCVCCGIRPTNCSIDIDASSSKKSKQLVYHINFYALSGVYGKDQEHMILFTKDHIAPRANGGEDTDENIQALCFNCNTFKGSSNLSLEDLQKALFPAYRAYQSSKALKRAKSALQPLYRRLVGMNIAINKIGQALNILALQDERRKQLEGKLETRKNELLALGRYVLDVELESQKTGIVPKILDNATLKELL